MKKIICAASAVLLCVLLLFASGCDGLSAAESIIGEWRSEDNYTVIFDGRAMTLYDENGEPVFDSPVEYTVNGNILYISAGDKAVSVFECRPDGDALTLVYTSEFCQLTGISSSKILLEKC